MNLFSPAALTRLTGLMAVNITLSGDNAVLIGMAAHRLHGRQRKLAILCGGGLAVFLMIIMAMAATFLLKIPALQFMGGMLLLWIAYKLLVEEIGAEEDQKKAESLWQAMWIITRADLIMSIDNILALAAMARGNMTLLAIGLAASMAIVLFAGGIVALLMERFPWIVYFGSIAIAYVAGDMMMNDPFVTGLIPGVMKALSNMQVIIDMKALSNMQVVIDIGILPMLLSIGVPVCATWRNRRKPEPKS